VVDGVLLLIAEGCPRCDRETRGITTFLPKTFLWHDYASDVNKDWTCKDKDQAYKDQDKDKD